MSIWTRDKIFLSADKSTFLAYDRGTETLSIVVKDTTVASMTATALTWEIVADEIRASSGTAAASSSAATINKIAGKVTSESLTTAAAAAETLTITDSKVAAADIVLCSVANGTNTGGTPVIGLVTPAAGSFTVTVENTHASEALDGTVVVSFLVIKTS